MTYTDNEIREWARMAMYRGGDFVKAMGEAFMRADGQNFELLRDVANKIINKYPKYLEWAREENKRRG